MEYMSLVNKVCKLLSILVCIGIVLIVITQTLLQFDTVRHMIVPVEKWEGERI